MEEDKIKWLEEQFNDIVGINGANIRFEDFKKVIKSQNEFFVERTFQIFDQDKDGAISLPEFIDSMHQFNDQNEDAKIKFLFQVYDIDSDGFIQAKELQQVMKACMLENGMIKVKLMTWPTHFSMMLLLKTLKFVKASLLMLSKLS